MNPLTEKVLGVSCSGLECTHELGEKHWVVTEDDIAKIHTLIRKETVKECVEILNGEKKYPKGMNATVFNNDINFFIQKLQALTKIST